MPAEEWTAVSHGAARLRFKRDGSDVARRGGGEGTCAITTFRGPTISRWTSGSGGGRCGISSDSATGSPRFIGVSASEMVRR